MYSSAGCTVAEKTFGTPKPTTEEDPVSLYLDSPYQMSKIIGEMYANYYWMHYGLPVVKARFQNVYGPGEVLGAGRWRGTPATVWRNVTPTFIYRSLKRIPLIVENEGIATRDFIYVEDIVDGLLKCAAAGKAGDVYNLAGGAETSILELARTINEMTGSQVPSRSGPDGTGITRAALRQHREGKDGPRLPGREGSAGRGSPQRSHGRGQPRPD